jgi:hypothetical protein
VPHTRNTGAQFSVPPIHAPCYIDDGGALWITDQVASHEEESPARAYGFGLAGCASPVMVSEVSGPDGSTAHRLICRARIDCPQQAAQLCPGGYEIVDGDIGVNRIAQRPDSVLPLVVPNDSCPQLSSGGPRPTMMSTTSTPWHYDFASLRCPGAAGKGPTSPRMERIYLGLLPPCLPGASRLTSFAAIR